MDILADIKTIFSQGEKFTKSKNYYFQTHTCGVIQDTVKVELNYIIHKEENNDQTINFVKLGICPHCNEVFYYKDYTNKSFSGKIKF